MSGRPSPILSINGNHCFVLFIDDYTKFVWIYFLASKSQVLTTFINFRKMIKTQFECEIKSFQSDWGCKYRNVSTYLQSCGIDYRVSCPHTPEQNGAVERQNRVIVEKELSLLAQSSLPHEYWEHAFKTASYLHNRTITPNLQYNSPYSKLYNKEPDYAFLHTFDCLCYPFLHPYNSHKMDFRSLPCIFLGYSASHKGYLCLHHPTSRIYISRHVVFNEDVFPCAYPSFTKPPKTYSTHQPLLPPMTLSLTMPSPFHFLLFPLLTQTPHQPLLPPPLPLIPRTHQSLPQALQPHQSLHPSPHHLPLLLLILPYHLVHLIRIPQLVPRRKAHLQHISGLLPTQVTK